MREDGRDRRIRTHGPEARNDPANQCGKVAARWSFARLSRLVQGLINPDMLRELAAYGPGALLACKRNWRVDGIGALRATGT